jgi:hypothetical protein
VSAVLPRVDQNAEQRDQIYRKSTKINLFIWLRIAKFQNFNVSQRFGNPLGVGQAQAATHSTVPCQIFGLVQKKSSSKISHPNFLSEIVTCSEFTGNAIFH